MIKKDTEKIQTDPKNEINILSKLTHPNIMKMYEYFEDESYFYIVTELCNGGEVYHEV